MTLTAPTLHTARLRLRAPHPEDAADLFALMSDPGVLRYWDEPPWTEPAQAERFIARSADLAAADVGMRLVIEGATDRAFVGWRAVGTWNPDFRSATVTYCLAPHAWGRGFATEAAGSLLDWAFASLHLNRVQTEVDTRNRASARVLEKLGFVREGTLRQDCIVNGEISDSWVYGLIAAGRPSTCP